MGEAQARGEGHYFDALIVGFMEGLNADIGHLRQGFSLFFV